MSNWTRFVIPMGVVTAVATATPLWSGNVQDQAHGRRLMAQAAAMTNPDVLAAQNMCTSRDNIVGMLSSEFREAPTAIGVIDRDAVMEVFVSEHGTWTIVASDPHGNSCIISAGEGWQASQAPGVEEQV